MREWSKIVYQSATCRRKINNLLFSCTERPDSEGKSSLGPCLRNKVLFCHRGKGEWRTTQLEGKDEKAKDEDDKEKSEGEQNERDEEYRKRNESV